MVTKWMKMAKRMKGMKVTKLTKGTKGTKGAKGRRPKDFSRPLAGPNPSTKKLRATFVLRHSSLIWRM